MDTSNFPYPQVSSFIPVYSVLQHVQPCSRFPVGFLSPEVASVNHLQSNTNIK